MAILECFQPGDSALGNTELAFRTGLSRPTAARLSSTLAELGYLSYDPLRAKYRLGLWALRLAWPVLSDMRVRQIARPLIQELAASIRGTVSLGIIDGLSVVYVESARGGELAPHFPELGFSLPLLRTAMGRALVSLLQADERKGLETRFKIEMPQMWKEFASNYRTGIAQCAQAGLCSSEGDFEPSIHGVAVPLYRAAETGDCFALSCAVSAFRLKPNELHNEIAPRFKALAATVRATVAQSGG